MAGKKFLATVMLAFFGAMAIYAYADGPKAATLGKPSSLSDLVGLYVSDPKGEVLGRVADFVIDPQGHVAFVILASGGFLGFGEKEVAVPFGSFAYDRERRRFVLDLTKEKLDEAPMFMMRDLYSEKWAAEDYRYFGQAPYWGEGKLVEKGIRPPKEPEKPLGNPFPYYYFTP